MSSSQSDFNPSYVIVYTPSCSKDINLIKMLGFWKSHSGAHSYLKELLKVDSLEKYRHRQCDCCDEWYVEWNKMKNPDDGCGCGCHQPNDGKYSEGYCFDSLIKKGDRGQFYNKLLKIDLVHPECGKYIFWVEKVESVKEYNDLMDVMWGSVC